MGDKRKPVLEKVGCYFEQGNGRSGFDFFKALKVSNNDIFVYNKGILWKLNSEAKKQAGEKK